MRIRHFLRTTRYFLAVLLVCLLFLLGLGAASAQDDPLPSATAPKLNITIVEREGAINNLRQRTTVVVIQVQDDNHRPVAGAAIVVKPLTAHGPASWFLRAKALTGVTDAKGLIRTAPLRINHMARLQVLASFHGQHAALVFSQAQLLGVAPAVGAGAATTATATVSGVVTVTGISVSVPALVAGAAAAAAAGAGGTVAAGKITQDNGGIPPSPPPTITIGLPGAPVLGPALLSGDPVRSGAFFTRSFGFTFGRRGDTAHWFGGQVFGPQFGAAPSFLGRLGANRFLQLTAAHVSIAPQMEVTRALTIGSRHTSGRRPVR